MDARDPANAYNITRSWNEAQGFTNVADEITLIRRDINIRHVSIENSSPDNSVGIAITTYFEGPIPKIQFVLGCGQIKSVGINTIGGPMQFLWILDLKGCPLGPPKDFRTDCNQFVLRQGLNKWFVQTFQNVGYKG